MNMVRFRRELDSLDQYQVINYITTLSIIRQTGMKRTF